MNVKYSNVTVRLTDQDGNAFAIIGAVTKALRRANVPEAEIDAVRGEMMNGDYDHLLQTAMKTVNVE